MDEATSGGTNQPTSTSKEARPDAKAGPDKRTRLTDALAAWRELLGPGRVVTSGEGLELANRATFDAARGTPAVLEPRDREEVAACLAVARRFGVAVYPVSAGLNWGYGSRLPARDGSVLLSLARLDRIVDFNEELAYVTVEPGVTFRRLAEYLRARGSRLMPPLTGASPDASLVGNALERGTGKGMYEDIAARTCDYEVVLASGRVVRTGFGSLAGALATPLRADGPGPSLQGLFAQSNFGVVTRMTFRLDPAPALRQQVVFNLRGARELSLAVDALREVLRRAGALVQVELMNDYRFLAQTRQFPFAERDASSPLSRARVEESLRAHGPARWFGCATVWADGREELAHRRDALVARLSPLASNLSCEQPTPGLEVDLSYDGLRCAYWRKAGGMPDAPHLDRDRCGVLWLAPVVPALGESAARAAELIEGLMLGRGFEPCVSLRLLDGRSIQALAGLFYDRDAPGADERALACYDELRAELYARGLYPYRLGLREMDSPPAADAATAELLRGLKNLLDPQHILAPGRYEPASPTTARAAPEASARDAAREPAGAAFESPLRIKVRTEFSAVGFGRVELAPEVARLKRELNEELSELVTDLPGEQAREARALLRDYSGDGDFFRLFYAPVWSFLHWASAAASLDPALTRAARTAHAMSMFLHLWDDHLCDGQLPVDLLRLQLRTLAWQRFASAGRWLCQTIDQSTRAFDEHAADYLTSLHRPPPAGDTREYCRRFTRQVAVWTLVPRLLGTAAGGASAADDLRGVVEDFAVAWRVVDDVQDVQEDLFSEGETAVWLELDADGRRLWAACRARSAAPASLDPETWAALSAHIRERGCLARLLSLVDERLRAASARASARGWHGLARELEQSRVVNSG